MTNQRMCDSNNTIFNELHLEKVFVKRQTLLGLISILGRIAQCLGPWNAIDCLFGISINDWESAQGD